MRVLIDGLVAVAQPLLASHFQDNRAHMTLGVFDPFKNPAEIADEISAFAPNLLVVDSAWLVIASMLMTIARLAGCGDVPCLIGTANTDNVVKIQASFAGFFDVVDLSDEPNSVVEQLIENHRGRSRLHTDRLWSSVSRPTVLQDVMQAPQDAEDLAILELIRIGLPDAEISEVVHMSQQTVRNRVSAMLRRSSLANRTQLAWAFTNQVLVTRMMEGMNARG